MLIQDHSSFAHEYLLIFWPDAPSCPLLERCRGDRLGPLHCLSGGVSHFIQDNNWKLYFLCNGVSLGKRTYSFLFLETSSSQGVLSISNLSNVVAV
jgi:hypothetical protein